MLYKAEGLGMLTLHLEHPSKVVSWHGEEIGVIDITELCLSAGFSDCLWSRAAGLQSGRRGGGVQDSPPCIPRRVHCLRAFEVFRLSPERFSADSDLVAHPR